METLLELLHNEIVLSCVFAVLGIMIKSYAPAWVPILGSSERVIKDLLKILNDTKTPNNRLIVEADKRGYKGATKRMKKEFYPSDINKLST